MRSLRKTAVKKKGNRKCPHDSLVQDSETGPSVLNGLVRKLDVFLSRYTGGIPDSIDLKVARAFVWDGAGRYLKPVKRPVRIHPDDLLGIEENKKLIIGNTKNFLDGKRANNVLLWGERGTGKSSLIKSLMTVFEKTTLRMVHVYKHDILTIQELYDFIHCQHAYKFVLFIDDLSFEENQTDYKELKTIMDGGLEAIPENLLFYATSNRKHLMPTRFSDRGDDEIRPGDSMEEKISLVDRFGLRLAFPHCSQETYIAMVDLYARTYRIRMERQELHHRAIQWAIESGGRNGRSAEQFVRGIQGL